MKTKDITRLRKVAKNRTLAFIDDVGFVSGGNITATNLDIFLTLPTDIEGEGKVYLSQLNGLKYDRAEIIDGSLILTNGKIKSKMSLPSDGDFPTAPVASKILGELDTIDIDNIKDAIKVAGTDELRPVMCGVFVDEDRVVATDAHRLVWHKKQGDAEVSGFIIPREVVAVLKSGKEYDTRISVGHSEPGKSQIIPYYVFQTNTERLVFKAIDGHYPNYKAVIPNNHEFRAAFDTAELIAGIEAAIPFANKTTFAGTFCFLPEKENTKTRRFKNGRKAILRALDPDDGKDFSFPMEIDHNFSDEPFFIGINMRFLKEFIDRSEPITTFEMSEPNRAIIINKNRLIMPVMILSDVLETIKQGLGLAPQPEPEPQPETPINADAEIGENSEQPQSDPETTPEETKDEDAMRFELLREKWAPVVEYLFLLYTKDQVSFEMATYEMAGPANKERRQSFMTYLRGGVKATIRESGITAIKTALTAMFEHRASETQPQPETSTPEPQTPNEEPEPTPSAPCQNIRLIEYSEKGIAVVGDIDHLRERLIEAYGSPKTFKHDGITYKGIAFSKKRKDKILEIINQ